MWFSDTDAQGVVYYGRYLPYFDHARFEYHRHLGLLGLWSGDREFVMRAVHVEYEAPARFDDLLEVFVRTVRIGRTSVTTALRGVPDPRRRADVPLDAGFGAHRRGDPPPDTDPGGLPRGGTAVRGRTARRPASAVSERISAGILLFRWRNGALEVLLAHPGGPYFSARDHGHWSIPKGEVEPGEALLDVARREFEEETGTAVPAAAPIPLGETRQKGGKLVHAWAVEGDLDPSTATSNEFEVEWPPRSGRSISVPEIDRVAWFDGTEARSRIKEAQAVFIDRLEAHLAARRERVTATAAG